MQIYLVIIDKEPNEERRLSKITAVVNKGALTR
jgi:hypothetical protein